MQFRLGIFFGSLLLLLAACNPATNLPIQGSGTLKTETRSLSGFEQVELDTHGTVTIVQGENPSVTVTTDDNIMQYITTKVTDKTLDLTVEGSVGITPTQLTYEVTVPALTAVIVNSSGSLTTQDWQTSDFRMELNGSGTITLSGFEVANLQVELNSSGTITAAGTAQNQTVTLNGSGLYAAFEVVTQNANVNHNASGTVQVQVTGNLNASLNGSGNLLYRGDAQVNPNVNGSGKIEKQ